MRRTAARLAAAVLVTAAAGLGLVPGTSAPAAAAACSGSAGVTVVVDHGSLGGGIDQVCSPSGGGKVATSILEGAGFALTYVQREPGFVCRIDGQPASDPCVNTPPDDAYWGLFWSDGRSGAWTYSSLGAGSLKIPDGGYVAFAWQNGGQHPPGVPATAHASTPTPTPTSAPPPTSTSAGGGGGGGGHHGGSSATPTTKPSTKPSAKPSTQATPTPSPTVAPSLSADTASADTNGSATPKPEPTPSPSDSAVSETPTEGTTSAAPSSEAASATPTADAVDAEAGEGSSLPAWVAPVVLVLLAGAGIATVLLRRRNRPSP